MSHTSLILSSRAQPPTRRRQPWLESIVAILILLAAWLYGFLHTRSPIASLVPNVLPGTQLLETRGETFAAFDQNNQLIGYAAAADSTGYGGPIYLLVGINPTGEIVGIQVIEQRETPGFYTILQDRRFVDGFLGQSANNPLVLGEDIDTVSGATLSAGAIAKAVYIAAKKIQTGLHKVEPPLILLGWPEITLLILFAGSFVLHYVRKPIFKKTVRWALLLFSMVVLGFLLNQPLTLANFASFLVGYWPTWQDHLYWYMLLGGSIGLLALQGKNIYCYTICPFGAVQECLGQLSGAKVYLPRIVYRQLSWVPRWMAVLALALGLAFRLPGAASYEPFGTLFSFTTGFFPWLLLVSVLFASMIILRPFCYYLCPVGAILNFLHFIRGQANRLWKTKQKELTKQHP